MNVTPISCIILAGGRGRRFENKDKGLVLLDGKPLIEHVIGCIGPQVDDIVISANRNTAIYRRYAERVIGDNTDDFQGPLSGIAACMTGCRHERILVVPCDIPLLPDDLVERLSRSDDRLSVARACEQRQLVFLMHRSSEKSLTTFLRQGHQKAMAWIGSQNPHEVEFEHRAGEFLNINTADELIALK